MSALFTPMDLRGTTIRNRVWVAPMCQYSAVDGFPDDWHLAHLGSFARGGAGLVMTEATAVSPEGRISPADTGIWNDEQMAAWERVAWFVKAQGATAAMQLAHAGRKASTRAPFDGRGPVADEDGGWEPVGPSPVPYPGLRVPHELTVAEIDRVVRDFAVAAQRALRAGFEVLEVHAAHGYLLHEFLSPLSNLRSDGYGGSFEDRVRLLLRVVEAVRSVVPTTVPVLVRISATDWVEGGWSVDDSVRLSTLLRGADVDLVDASSGGNVLAEIPLEPKACGRYVTDKAATRSASRGGSVPRRRSPPEPSASSPSPSRPRRSSPTAARTRCCWPGRCCGTRTGLWPRRTSSGYILARESTGRASTSGPRSTETAAVWTADGARVYRKGEGA